MDFTFFITNLIRVIVVIMTAIKVFKRDFKKLGFAAVSIALSFVPWLFGLIDINVDMLTKSIYQIFIFMAVFLGQGYRYYDLYSWWDRVIHLLSGVVFSGFAVAFAEKENDISLAGTLIFAFVLSLALHEIWEVLEFAVDSIFKTDHQHWQKNSKVVNHQPKKAIQPPGLVDTMSDSIFNIIGTAVACAGWWVYLA